MTGLIVLAVDDEAPALDELAFLLNRNGAVDQVLTASDATSALRELADHRVDGVFLDISMPALSGMELAGVLAKYADPPPVVFVTAHDDRAVEAFGVGAVDYLLKPLREDQLTRAVERIAAHERPRPDESVGDDAVIPVESGGVTSLVRRDAISWVEAVGDYARLHTDTGSHLVRVTLSTLESRWQTAGFARVHRSYLVNLPMVVGLRSAGASTMVRVKANGVSQAVELPVSRRQVRELKDRLVRDPMRTIRSGGPASSGS
ncbi:LytTR family DNA-binding domain-containing protein [Gordonia sp. HY002]|uniref:LytR/AlgR family response regulator transcription factor n=1 Tax=Gordonia zhenghanii TaxID=2911516 RepID=UPI001EF05683|nr:LytTR family DNA-binding domain-containing protein [Gordonia zhenghanii]MCF8569076.1 LytTR family DNA-binding domain-containing protein [Gordonia zhenghanii]MCF8603395.1 LytTR family DNA-binding domain-containing protein [Gordonia zhenghanii]